MPDSQIEEIKSKLNIVDVVAEYVQLKKVGANFKARCPFHTEKTASFYVSPARQIWHCFGCNLGGDIFEFIKQIESCDFREALEKLAQKAGVTLTRRAPSGLAGSPRPDERKVLYELNDLAAKYYNKVLTDSQAAKEAREYLKKRKFKPATIAAWRLGYAPDSRDVLFQFLKKRGHSEAKIVSAGLAGRGEHGGYYDRFRDRITFPILDASGRTVGFSARLLHHRDDVGKYINSPDSVVYNKSRVLFGFYQAKTEIRRQNAAIIVEGNVDVIKSHQAGITNVVASSGTALTEAQLGLLKRLCENLIFAFDADSAGLQAARRALDLALAAGFTVKLINLSAGMKDPDEIIDSDPGLWKKLIEGAVDYLDFYFHRIFDILDLKSAQAKKAAKDDFLSLLALVYDRTVAEHYVHETALALGANERTLVDELNSLRKKNSQTSQQSAAEKTRPAPVPARELLESRFLGSCLLHPELAKPYLSKIPAGSFSNELYARIFSAFARHLKKRGDDKAEAFLKTEPEAKTLRNLASLSEEVEPATSDQTKQEIKALYLRIKSGYFKHEKERLSAAIAAAERSEKSEEKNKLINEFNALLQEASALEREEN